MQDFISSENKTLARKAAIVCAIAALAALLVVRFDDVLAALGLVMEVMTPFLAGFALAYLINLLMRLWERVWFPRAKSPLIVRTRRAICLILSIGTVVAIVAAVVTLLAGEVRTAFGAVRQGFVAAFQTLATFIGDDPQLSSLLQGDVDEWLNAAERALASVGGAGSAASVVARWGGNVAHAVLDGVIAIIFALYVLIGKERVVQGARTAGQTVLPPNAFALAEHVCHVANVSFSRFISGQCLEACILGVLCALGMTIFGFPYAGSIGLCVGITSLIPFIGAWIGGAVGAFIIASVSVEQAVLFVVFLVILQQIEGHAIYPNVVGSSVGMPGIWTFFAVVAGGALFGVLGVLLGVPVVSTIRTLALEWKDARTKKRNAPNAAVSEQHLPHEPRLSEQTQAQSEVCKAAPGDPQAEKEGDITQ